MTAMAALQDVRRARGFFPTVAIFGGFFPPADAYSPVVYGIDQLPTSSVETYTQD